MSDFDASKLPESVARSAEYQLDIVKFQIAREYAPRTWHRAFDDLIYQLQRGRPCAEVVQTGNWQGAAQLRATLHEAINTTDPGHTLLEMMQLRQRTRRHWGTITSNLAYPVIITLVSLMVGTFFAYALVGGGTGFSDFVDGYDGWGAQGMTSTASLFKDQANAFIGISAVVLWCLAIAAALRLFGSKWAIVSVISGLPLFGRPYRWLALSEILGQLHLFISQGKTVTESVRTVERSMRHSGLAQVVQAVGDRIESGMSMGQAFRLSTLSDGLSRPALGALDRLTENSERGVMQVSDLLVNMAARRCQLLSATMPVIVLLLAGSIIWNTLQCYIVCFMALVSIITSLA